MRKLQIISLQIFSPTLTDLISIMWTQTDLMWEVRCSQFLSVGTSAHSSPHKVSDVSNIVVTLEAHLLAKRILILPLQH